MNKAGSTINLKQEKIKMQIDLRVPLYNLQIVKRSQMLTQNDNHRKIYADENQLQ